MTYKLFWGNILRNLRNKYHLRQYEIADILKIPRQAYSNIECGHTHPTPEQLAILSDLYDVDLNRYILNSLPEEFLKEHHEFKAHMHPVSEVISEDDLIDIASKGPKTKDSNPKDTNPKARKPNYTLTK